MAKKSDRLPFSGESERLRSSSTIVDYGAIAGKYSGVETFGMPSPPKRTSAFYGFEDDAFQLELKEAERLDSEDYDKRLKDASLNPTVNRKQMLLYSRQMKEADFLLSKNDFHDKEDEDNQLISAGISITESYFGTQDTQKIFGDLGLFSLLGLFSYFSR